MKMELDMGVLMTNTKGKNVVTLELGMSESGEAIYTISWYNGKQWGSTPRFYSIEDAYAMYKLLFRMI